MNWCHCSVLDCSAFYWSAPAVYLTAVHLGSEYLTAVHLIQLKLTAFNLTATDTNLQARRTFNFLAMNKSINQSINQLINQLITWTICRDAVASKKINKLAWEATSSDLANTP